MAKTKKKNYALVILFVLLIGISVGYAAFAQQLTINGTANANGNFKLAFTKAIIDPNVGAEGSTTSISATGDNLSINMELQHPGAGAVVTATITNTGSIAAKLNDINFTGTEDEDILVSFDHSQLADVIEPNKSKDILITVKWADNSKEAKKVNFTATLDYVQSTTNFDPNAENTQNPETPANPEQQG